MMKRAWFVILLLCGGIAYAQAPHLFEHTYPVVQQEDARIRQLMDSVSADRIESTIDHLQSYHTRRWDSRMVYEVEDWLYDQYTAMGFDTVFTHDFVFEHHDTIYQSSDNVIAIQRGTVYPDEYVVCGAHYDSYNNSAGDPDSLRAPGADDNASGVSGVMEMARLLGNCKFERSIMYCHWAAEEVGLKGSAAFAKDCADAMVDIVGYFNLDMIGYLEEGSDIHVHLMYTTQDSIIARYVYNLSHVYFPEMPIRQAWLAWGDSDYSSFNRNGYAAVHTFEDVNASSPYIHSPSDVLGLSVNNMDQAKRFTELNLGLVATLAGLVDTGVDETDNNPLRVYPNPAQGRVTIEGLPMRAIEVYNPMGQLVLNETCRNEQVLLDVSSLAAGVYVMRVVDDAMRIHTRRLVTY